MNNRTKVLMSSFLIERNGRYKPADKKIANLKRLDKIDFSGVVYLSNKPTKTDMIMIKPGDLIISGINVAKGALAVYEGEEPITATIHYSSYIFDKNKIDISYLKLYLKSPLFIQELQRCVKGGIKTEIKPKHLLSLEINLPDITEQKRISEYFLSFENELKDINSEQIFQKEILTRLRQSILQEAIEGKLTAQWRKSHPVKQNNPNYDAVALIERVRTEKQKLIANGYFRDEKPLVPIISDDIPFILPDGWIWSRLGEILKNPPRNGYSPKEVSYKTKVKSLKLGATTWGVFNPLEYKYIDEEIAFDSVFWLKPNDLLIQRSNSIDYVGVTAIFTGGEKEFIYPDLMMKLEIMDPLSVVYVHKVLSAPLARNYFRSNAKGSQKSMPKINQGIVNNTLIPLPPLAEQQAIVERVEKLLSMVDELDKQVEERKTQAKELMQAVLREAFEGENNG